MVRDDDPTSMDQRELTLTFQKVVENCEIYTKVEQPSFVHR